MKLPPSRTERLIRAVILLAACALFSCIAWLAGAYNFTNQNWTYACIIAIVGASALVSRYGAKWVMGLIASSQTRE